MASTPTIIPATLTVTQVTGTAAEMMTEGGPVALTPGMSVTAEIKTGKRKVIDYLLSPVLRCRQDTMREMTLALWVLGGSRNGIVGK